MKLIAEGENFTFNCEIVFKQLFFLKLHQLYFSLWFVVKYLLAVTMNANINDNSSRIAEWQLWMSSSDLIILKHIYVKKKLILVCLLKFIHMYEPIKTE